MARPRAVVTGGHGFIGAWVVRRLAAEGCRVLIVDHRDAAPASSPEIDSVAADIASPEAARAVVAFEPELVVHAAAQTRVSRSVAEPAEDARVNVGGTVAMLEAARQARSRGFVFLSSAAIYGEPGRLPLRESHSARPLSPYGLSKLAATTYVDYYRSAGLVPALALIPANAYGPGQEVGSDGAVVASFMRAAVAGEPLTLAGDGTQTRDFVYVEDIVEAIWLAWRWLEAGAELAEGVRGAGREAAASADPEVAAASDGVSAALGSFNLGTGVQTRIADLAARVEVASGRKLGRVAVPSRPGDIRRSCLDPALARATLGWSAAVGLDEGLARTFAWWQKRG